MTAAGGHPSGQCSLDSGPDSGSGLVNSAASGVQTRGDRTGQDHEVGVTAAGGHFSGQCLFGSVSSVGSGRCSTTTASGGRSSGRQCIPERPSAGTVRDSGPGAWSSVSPQEARPVPSRCGRGGSGWPARAPGSVDPAVLKSVGSGIFLYPPLEQDGCPVSIESFEASALTTRPWSPSSPYLRPVR